ncbi:hypothetical protein [Nonomuraea sp. NPDC050783]|uniref:hypothetical protein n=1 Tax=Nonomuraea sp. NPDC050783 TaxID=3154634 RepID=UPI0034660199
MAALVIGSRLQSIHYVMPRGSGWPDGRERDGLHEVDMGVELITVDGAALSLSWAMEGLNEGLAIDFFPFPGVEDDRTEAIDVSGVEEWQPLLGGTIASMAFSSHFPNEGCPETLWSVRLSFAGASSVVVALGEVMGGGISYQPDELVVIFDEALSKSYRIPAGRFSSWGVSVEPDELY